MFTIAVTIFIIYFATFTIYQEYYLTSGVNDQLTEIKSYMSTHILKVAVTDANTTTLLIVPRYVANERYKVELSDNGITLTSLSSMTTQQTSLLNLNKTISFSGQVTSGSGKITLLKRGNEIRII